MPERSAAERANLLVILIDDLRYDEFGAGGHPYMQTPHIDRLAHEGALFERAFHTTPICSPNRASIVTGQYASRHGIIDNVARDAMSHRLPNYHLELQRLGYETAHIGKWHMGNDGMPRPGYDHWVSFDGHGRLVDPSSTRTARYAQHTGYVTDILNELRGRLRRAQAREALALFFAHKAVHPDAEQAADGTLDLTRHGGYIAGRAPPRSLPRRVFPPRPNMLPPERGRAGEAGLGGGLPAQGDGARRRRCWPRSTRARRRRSACARAMMASVDEGVGMLLDALERTGQLDDTLHRVPRRQRLLLRRARARAGAPLRLRGRHPLAVPRALPAAGQGGQRGSTSSCSARTSRPTLIELAGGTPGPQIQGRSLVPLLRRPARGRLAHVVPRRVLEPSTRCRGSSA